MTFTADEAASPATEQNAIPALPPFEEVEVPVATPVVVRPAIWTRTLPVFAILVAAGALMLLFASRTVHRWSPEEFLTNGMALRSHAQTSYWLEHGYLDSAGLLVATSATKPAYFYRSSTGGVYVSGFIAEKIYSLFTGHYSWRLMALHNQLFMLLTSAVLALLGYLLARRMGATPLHAMTLAVSLEAVHFTFPDNLTIYWEMSARIPWLLFACLFLILELRMSDSRAQLRARDGRSRALSIAQAVCAFALTYMEFVAGVMFVVAYVVVSMLLDRTTSWKRITLIAVVPMLLAIGLYRGQIALAHVLHPEMEMDGSEFMFRTGLDGSEKYYTDHLDIALRRDFIRTAVFPKAGPWLFRWKWMFVAGTLSVLSILLLAMRGKVAPVVVLSLLSLLGSYLLYAALFSQAIFIHPYLYDVMLFTPLALALFVLVPAIVETVTEHRGVAVAMVFFLAVWLSNVQLRRYALQYPPPPGVEAAK